MNYGDAEPSESHGGEAAALAPAVRVTFDRRELNRIFGLYGRKVAAGEWRDYAIDFLRDRAVFHGRERLIPRKHHRIWLVLGDGRICLRKMLVAQERGVFGSLRRYLRWGMYIEAAGLLRLRGAPGFPSSDR